MIHVGVSFLTCPGGVSMSHSCVTHSGVTHPFVATVVHSRVVHMVRHKRFAMSVSLRLL